MEPVTAPSYDNELLKVHLALAAEALPGPDYYSVLQWVHQILRPERYLEVGIRQGESLRLALPETECIGIDPTPLLQEPPTPKTKLFAMTSNEFFESQNLVDIWGVGTFSLAFVDGLHLFEQALLDFANLERLATTASIIMIHDCLPLDATTSERTRSTHFYSGDVWKLAMCLKNRRPDLKIKTIRTGPTGLCLVGNLQSQSDLSLKRYKEYIAEYLPLRFADYTEPSWRNARDGRKYAGSLDPLPCGLDSRFHLLRWCKSVDCSPIEDRFQLQVGNTVVVVELLGCNLQAIDIELKILIVIITVATTEAGAVAENPV